MIMTKNYVSPLFEEVTLLVEGGFASSTGESESMAAAGSLGYYESDRWDGIE